MKQQRARVYKNKKTSMQTKITVNGVTLELEAGNAEEMREAIKTALRVVLPVQTAERRSYTHTAQYNTRKKRTMHNSCIVCGKGMYRKAKTCSILCHSKRMSESAHNAYMRRTPEQNKIIAQKRARSIRATYAKRRGITPVDFEAIKREYNSD